MPIYEYGCNGCERVVERFEPHQMEQPSPSCCDKPMERLMSVVAFDLRGSGFHQNDYGNGAHKLSATHQAQRASVECDKLELVPASPKGQPSERQIDKMREKVS